MKKFLIMTILVLGIAAQSRAVPNQITYQGTLKEKGVPANGTKSMKFEILNGNQSIWTYQKAVTVTNGLFSVILNPTGVDWEHITPSLQITIENQLLTPPEPITANAYSLVASAVIDKAISPSKIVAGYGLVPSGTIIMFAGAVVPSGYLLCDGSSVSRTTYNALFAAIGTSWGAGDGGSTFNLPDLRGRSPIGAGQGAGLTNRTLGQTFGEETHTLTVAEIPSHSHGVSDPGHFHDEVGVFSPGTVPTLLMTNGNIGTSSGSNLQTNTKQTGISLSNTGSNSAHNNMQPSAIVSFIIKI